MNEVSFQRSKKEILRIWTMRTFLRKRMILRIIVVILGGVLLLLCDGFYRYLGGAFLLYLAYLPIGTVAALSQVLDANPQYTSPTVLVFRDQGIVVSATGVKAEISWQSFTGWSESGEYFFLRYFQQPLDMIIPKRAFAPEQAAAFTAHLKRIGGKGLLQPTSKT